MAFVEDLDDLDMNFAGMPTMDDVPDLFVQLWDGYQLGTERLHSPPPQPRTHHNAAGRAFFDRLFFQNVGPHDGGGEQHPPSDVQHSGVEAEGLPPADRSTYTTY